MENERNAQAAAQPAEEKKPVEEKKPGYPMHKRKYTPLYTIIVFLYGLLVKLLFFMKIEGRENVPKDRNCILMGQPPVPARPGDAGTVRAGQGNSLHGQKRAV